VSLNGNSSAQAAGFWSGKAPGGIIFVSLNGNSSAQDMSSELKLKLMSFS
jgi:hypothetical protein